jgi:hypothetical protein
MRQLQSRPEIEHAVSIGANRPCPTPARIGLTAAVDLRPEAVDYFIGIRVHQESQTRGRGKKVRALPCRPSCSRPSRSMRRRQEPILCARSRFC